MNSLLGNLNEKFRQLKFTSEEIAEAISRDDEKHGVEVSYCPSEIKIYRKDKNSLNDPVKLTVEEYLKVPGRIWHMELLSTAKPESEFMELGNHVRWADIPFTAMLDKAIECLDYDPYFLSVGKEPEEKC